MKKQQSLGEWLTDLRESGELQKTPLPEEYKKILQSRIFKLDKDGKPEGIFNLYPKPKDEFKSLSKTHTKMNLLAMIRDISKRLDTHSRKVNVESLQRQLLTANVISLLSCLKTMHFTTDELDPQLKNLVKKMDKVITKKIKKGFYPGLTGPSSEILKKAFLIDALVKIFKYYLETKDRDAFNYVAYLLIDIGIEDGNIKEVFNRVRKRYYDNRKVLDKTNYQFSLVKKLINQIES